MRAAPILLDTCASLWATTSQSLTKEGERALAEAAADEVPIFVSPITAWEVGQLVAKGRLALSEDPKVWFAGVVESGIGLAELTPDTLIAASFLPSCALRDPADRILAATARSHGYRLMTRDRPILDYGQAGWVRTLAC